MALDHLPNAVDFRVIRGAVIDQERAAQEQAAKDQPGTHHPAHIRHPIDDLTRVQVGAKCHILGSLYRKAAVGVDGAFWPAGGAGGINDHQRVFGCGGLCIRRQETAEGPARATKSPRPGVMLTGKLQRLRTITFSTELTALRLHLRSVSAVRLSRAGRSRRR